MKKRKLKSLELNKKTVSTLNGSSKILGGKTGLSGTPDCDGEFGSHLVCYFTYVCPSDQCPGTYYCNTGQGHSDCPNCDSLINCVPDF